MHEEGKKNFDWDEEKTSQFIVWDYIEHMNKMGYYDTQNFFANNSLVKAQKYKKYKIIIDLIDSVYNNIFSICSNIFLKLAKQKNIKKKILFEIARNNLLISAIKKDKNYSVETFLSGEKHRLFAIKNFIKYTSYTDLNRLVYDYLTKKEKCYLYKLINIVKKRIKRMNPDYVVLSDGALPIERAIVLAAKELGIPTIVVQHGVYQSTFSYNDFGVADYVLVWGQYFKDWYIKNGRKSEEIYILGYPYSIFKSKAINKKDKHYVVYYLGHNFEKYNKKLLDIKIRIIGEINNICNKSEMKFIYRSHPGSDRKMLKNKLPKVHFSSESEKLIDTFNKGDIFISFNSTSLIEATMRSKISLQLMNYPLKTDNLEELGACSKSFKTIEELENYLTKVAGSQNLNEFKSKFNNDYIDLSYNPDKRFLELLNNIRKDRKQG